MMAPRPKASHKHMTPNTHIALATSAEASASTQPWTCPFCPLLCDAFKVTLDKADSHLRLSGSHCHRAQSALATFKSDAASTTATQHGQACTLDDAIAAAARLLVASHQPLFGGLGTDVAGARALYRLAAQTGAICDAAGGRAQMDGLRALQDRGAFTTSLAEVRTRADVIVCLGGWPTQRYPEFFNRCGVGEALVKRRDVVVLGAQPSDAPDVWAALSAAPGVTVSCLPWHGDAFTTLQCLSALVAGRAVPEAPEALSALAAQLRAATYGVMAYQTYALPEQGALIVEAANHLVGQLNQHTRAATLALGGDDGANTVNQVMTWTSGLPLRSRAGPLGLEHDPLCFDAATLLADHAVDALLWVSSFGATQKPPTSPPGRAVPTVVLGHPDLASSDADVFIPVATPGVDVAGHLFRTDSVVLMPLSPVHARPPSGLPTVHDMLDRLSHAVTALRAAATPPQEAP